ncbi:unnamed protein product, partial [Thelazia callipaeda]|uniref:REKLES domain-containing protein n=1 Tax=Thelazia callipaeda TaxID=103827 RepID=A0A0N5D4G4_THECL
YQKYLYDYECEKEGLSTATDLQQAIDGNRREGRRNTSSGSTNYAQVGYSVAATAAAAAAHHNSTALLNKHLNGTLSLRNGLDDDAGLGPASQQAALVAAAAYRAEQLAVLEAQQRQFERARRAAVEAVTRHSAHANTNSALDNTGNNSSNSSAGGAGGMNHHHSHVSGRESTSSADSDGATPAKRARAASLNSGVASTANAAAAAAAAAAVAAAALNNENGLSNNLLANLATERLLGSIPSAHLKITNRGENSLVVSMEINGTMYQGVLFALGAAATAASTPQNLFQNVSDAAAMATGLNLATTLNNPL